MCEFYVDRTEDKSHFVDAQELCKVKIGLKSVPIMKALIEATGMSFQFKESELK